jgi:DNA mismatch repair protein MutS2
VSELKDLDWKEILHHIQTFATSGTAKLEIEKIAPLPTPTAAQGQMLKIFDGAEILALGTRPFMESLDLFEAWYSRVRRKAVLKTLEIRDVRTFCLEILALKEVFSKCSNSWSQNSLLQLMKAEEPLSAIDQIMTPRGEIRSDASETLFRLFNEKENLGRQIQNSLDRLVNDQQMQSYLQDKYVTTREGRWVLPVRSGSQHSVGGVIHGSSQTKQTVFMEPEVVIPLNNRLRQVEVEIEDEIERLLHQLSMYLANQANDFAKSREILLEADQIFAQSQWSMLIEAQAFEFSSNEIFLNEVKHPLLVAAAKNPVPNSVHLRPEKSILLLSGPNAGGKTVLLKSIGLASQMAACGLPICAGEGSRLPFFKKIIVGIGDSQNVGQDLSTFAAHLKMLEAATLLKGPDSLILVDEICGSTDPEEGSALARAFIEKFSSVGAFAVITSHLGPLKIGWTETDRVMNGSLEYDAKSGKPTYNFIQGIAGDSLALQTARRVGVAKDIIDRAVDFMSPAQRERIQALDQLDQIKSDLHLLQESLKKDQSKARAEKEKYEKLREQLEKEKENLLSKTLKTAEKKIEDLISHAKVDQTFTRHRSLQEIKTQLPEIVKSRPGISTTNTVTTSEEFGKFYPPGTKVFVPALGQDGLIQSTPNSKGEVLVLSNSIRLMLSWKELKPPAQAQNPTANLVRRSSSISVALQDQDRTLDLRGKTTEEALRELEDELDHAIVSKEDRLKVVHGHGTEVLKKAVRTFLSRSLYVKKWKAGSPEQGGDGVTWVELSDDGASTV